jgi:hypothetical protein
MQIHSFSPPEMLISPQDQMCVIRMKGARVFFLDELFRSYVSRILQFEFEAFQSYELSM